MTTTGNLSIEARTAIQRVLEQPVFELIPLKNVLEQARYLPAGSWVSVTASPAKGMEATLDLAEALLQEGFRVVPHISARLTRDRHHLEQMLARLDALEIRRAFVVGGDADDPGEFFDGLSLLRAMKEIGYNLDSIGIPSYPEGHPVIWEPALDQALADKQPFARSMTTQMCFSGEAIVDWAGRQRAAGISLPIVLGMPGVADRMRLLKISARIGVGDSIRFLRKNASVARFMLPGSYNPAELLEELGADIDDPSLDIQGVHIYTFNSCDATEEWRRQYLESLA